ncbi:hypothetical protein ACWKWU_13540 [Chitinophaga lutea]
MAKQPPGSIPAGNVTVTRYDYVQLLQMVGEKGQALYGPQYTIHDVDRALVTRLITYFTADEHVAAREGIQLHKGLLLCGPVGCGKSSLLNIMRSLSGETKTYGIVSCRNLVTHFNEAGFGVIHRYSCLPGAGALATDAYCFDDLGLEPPGSFYKNDCNVMAEILFNRYEAFVHRGILTHVTTNLGAPELESMYGHRLRSRMREMFNLLAFDEQSPDKRR